MTRSGVVPLAPLRIGLQVVIVWASAVTFPGVRIPVSLVRWTRVVGTRFAGGVRNPVVQNFEKFVHRVNPVQGHIPAFLVPYADRGASNFVQSGPALKQHASAFGSCSKVTGQGGDLPELKAGAAKELGRRAGLVDVTEDAWNAERARRATTAIKKARADAETVKRAAMRALRYFMCKDDEVQARLREIAEGSGDVDLVDDCSRLATLVDDNAGALAKAKLGSQPGAKLRAAGAKLADVTSDQASDAAPGDSIALRNRAFWYLRRFSEEVRAAGRYAFADDPRKLVKYQR